MQKKKKNKQLTILGQVADNLPGEVVQILKKTMCALGKC